jgi:Rrf2 family transcriptional regulator, nitric oxide-sensitive transcriptional repressor
MGSVKLSVFTECAVRTLVHLAQHPGHYVTLRSVADTYELSRNHLMKVTLHLGAEGHIMTLRGQHGGMRLKVPASEIRLGQLIHRAERESRLQSSSEGLPHGTIDCGAQTALAIKAAYQAFIDTLDSYTIEDLLNAPSPPLVMDMPAPVVADYSQAAV